MMRRVLAGVVCALLLITASGRQVVAQSSGNPPPIYTIVDLGVPGFPFGRNFGGAGINNQGVIVGAWTVSPAVNGDFLDPARGFRWENGVVTDVLPDALQLIGALRPRDGFPACDGQFTSCSLVHVIPRDINDGGTIAGTVGIKITYCGPDAPCVQLMRFESFVMSPAGASSLVYAPDGKTPSQSGTFGGLGGVTGISNQVVGLFWAIDRGFQVGHGFYGSLTLAYPGTPERTSTGAFGANNFGDVVGFYGGALSESDDPLNPTRGFVYRSGQYLPVNMPDSYHTEPFAINDQGTIVGTWVDDGSRGGIQRSFVWPGYGQNLNEPYEISDGVRPDTPFLPYGINNTGQMVGILGDPDTGGLNFAIAKPCIDSDGDALCDEWETNGLDVKVHINGSLQTVHLDLPAMGADPQHKDIFVQADYMDAGGHTHVLSEGASEMLIEAFANAPVPNPDGQPGIALHIDCGAGCIMNPRTRELWGDLSRAEILIDTPTAVVSVRQPAIGPSFEDWSAFDVIKQRNFPGERHRVFHYAIMAHTAGQDVDADGTVGLPFSLARDIPSSDFVMSAGPTNFEEAITFMHELGHNLGLKHGGGDDDNFKPNYLSIMNYVFADGGLVSHGEQGLLDYSRFELPLLDKAHLNETVGLLGGTVIEAIESINAGIFPADYSTFFGCGLIDQGLVKHLAPATGPINWNCNEDSGEIDVPAPINDDPSRYDSTGNVIDPSPATLRSFSDWRYLTYAGGLVGGHLTFALPAQTPFRPEPTPEILERMPSLFRVAVVAPVAVSGPANSTVSVTVTIQNRGSMDDTYSIVVSSDKAWADFAAVPTSVSVAAGATSAPLVIPVNFPSTAVAGDVSKITVRAQSGNSRYMRDSRVIKAIASSGSGSGGNGQLVLNLPQSAATQVGSTSPFACATFTDQGGPGAGPWAASIDYGDGSALEQLTGINAGGTCGGSDAPTGSFSLSHAYAGTGNYTVTITLTDSLGATTTGTLSITVTSGGGGGGGGNISLSLPSTTSTQVGSTTAWACATFTDPGGVSAGPWSATVDYGDGSGIQQLTGIAAGGSCGGFGSTGSFNLFHAYPATGNFVVAITLTNSAGLSASGNIAITVTSGGNTGGNISLSLPQSATTLVGSTSNWACATFTDPAGTAGGPWTGTVDYGDGSGIQELTGINAGGTCGGPGAPTGAFNLSHGYASPGDFIVALTITNFAGLSASGNISITVTSGGGSGQLSLGLPQSTGTQVNSTGPWACATFFDPAGVSGGPWSATVNYGDGSVVQQLTGLTAGGTCGGSGGSGGPTGAFNLSHAYATTGTFTVAVTLTNVAGVSTNGTFSITVSGGSSGGQLSLGLPQSTGTQVNSTATFACASFFDPAGAAGGPWAAAINYGDGSVVQQLAGITAGGTCGSSGGSGGPTGAFNLSHAYATTGTFTVAVTLTNVAGVSTNGTFSITVSGGSSGGQLSLGLPQSTGTQVNSTGTFACASFFDPAGAAGGPWAAAINYGDGSVVQQLTGLTAGGTCGSSGESGGPTGAFNLSHAYAATGTYTVTVSVTNYAGSSATRTFSVTVSGQIHLGLPQSATTQVGSISTWACASFNDPAGTMGGPWSATVNYGDGSGAQTLTISNSGGSCGGSSSPTGAFNFTHAYSEPGAYTVTVRVTNNAGTSGTGSFGVIVEPNETTAIQLLWDQLAALTTNVGPGKSLAAKVRAARSAYEAGNAPALCAGLANLLSEVRAQTGKHVSAAQATAISTVTNELRMRIGC